MLFEIDRLDSVGPLKTILGDRVSGLASLAGLPASDYHDSIMIATQKQL